jgi:hypothetical protein
MAITSSDNHHTEQSSSCEPRLERKELKQARRYDIQNAVLQRLFRPTTPATQDEREQQESSQVELNREWGGHDKRHCKNMKKNGKLGQQ